MISITGHLGSGKSTISRMLATWLNCPRFSTGDAQRAMASERGLTSLELNLLSESEPEIDFLIDSASARFAAVNEIGVLDSRLAWHFVPGSFKVCLTVNPTVAAQRVLSDSRGPVESFGNIEEALDSLRKRRASERTRYASLYQVDVDRLANFDLVIDTSFLPPRSVRNAILASFNHWKKRAAFSKFVGSPRSLFPLARPDHSSRLEVGYVDQQFFVLTGDSVVEARLAMARELISAHSILEGHELWLGQSISDFVKATFSLDRMREWEARFGFSYPGPPDFARLA